LRYGFFALLGFALGALLARWGKWREALSGEWRNARVEQELEQRIRRRVGQDPRTERSAPATTGFGAGFALDSIEQPNKNLKADSSPCVRLEPYARRCHIKSCFSRKRVVGSCSQGR